MLAGGPEFEKAFGMRPLSKRRLWNGPIECELLTFEMRGKTKRMRGLDARAEAPDTDDTTREDDSAPGSTEE